MTLSRLIQQLLEIQEEGAEDLEVQLEIGGVKHDIADVYEDPAYDVVFIASEDE